MASTRPDEPGLGWLLSGSAVLWVWGPLIAVAALHYLTPPDPHWVHDLARRLYYLPIVLAGSHAGLRGGLLTAFLAAVVYLPHAFMNHVFHDPATPSEKLLEIAFYFVLGAASGIVAERAAVERIRLQATLADLEARDEELRRAARLESLGALTAGLAHEIRNPLHAMRGTAEILLDAVPAGSPESAIGGRLIAEIDRLSSLLTRFLGFAKGQASDPKPVAIGPLLEEVRGLMDGAARRQETELHLAPAPDVAVHADHDQLLQVVMGVAINALQAVRRGGRIELGVEKVQPDGVVVFVRNDGPPIPADVLPRIFDPFVSTREQGTGLGLSTAWRILDAHGGSVTASNEDPWVVFRIRLRRV